MAVCSEVINIKKKGYSDNNTSDMYVAIINKTIGQLKRKIAPPFKY